MIDLSKLDPSEAERLAHTEGVTGVATLYARWSDAEHMVSTQADQIENMKQTLLQCLPFFEDRRDELGDTAPRTMAFMIKLIRGSLGE